MGVCCSHRDTYHITSKLDTNQLLPLSHHDLTKESVIIVENSFFDTKNQYTNNPPQKDTKNNNRNTSLTKLNEKKKTIVSKNKPIILNKSNSVISYNDSCIIRKAPRKMSLINKRNSSFDKKTETTKSKRTTTPQSNKSSYCTNNNSLNKTKKFDYLFDDIYAKYCSNNSLYKDKLTRNKSSTINAKSNIFYINALTKKQMN